MTDRTLADHYHVSRNFQRAKRIDTDLSGDGIRGYHLNKTAGHILSTLCDDVAKSRQRAFTWTGPYGSGKSSLALLLAAALGPDGELRQAADLILGREHARRLRDSLGRPKRGWFVVPIVGRRGSPVDAIWEALLSGAKARWGKRSGLVQALQDEGHTSERLIVHLAEAGRLADNEGGGLLLLIDEMGKFLEHAALDNGDLFPFQDIAESFGRSPQKCVLLGILHQSFEEYGRRASRGARAEWSKIQGRFSDFPFSIGIDEVVGLIAAALTDALPKRAHPLAARAVEALETGRLAKSEGLALALTACRPLHPVTALLLGPISRRRFGQNERSVFTFLGSQEPNGFGEFLASQPADSDCLFTPADLWDYLQLNLEPTILASSDGHRWAEAAEAVLRASRREGATERHVALAKTIALLDVFGRAHGLPASNGLVSTCFADAAGADLVAALEDLKRWAVVIHRRYNGGWGVFAGSDIDLDAEVDRAAAALRGDHRAIIAAMPDPTPIVAKRHYAVTGTLRLFERRVVDTADLERAIAKFEEREAATGLFLLAIGGESAALQTSLFAHDVPVYVARIHDDHKLMAAALEVSALERVRATTPELQGDATARRELNGRLTAAQRVLAEELGSAFDTAEWTSSHAERRVAGEKGLSELASDLCDRLFACAPKIFNELLNRDRPSPAAVAARRRLMFAMIGHGAEHRLAIEGAELGLYLSLLGRPGLHRKDAKGAWAFARPTEKSYLAAWEHAEAMLQQNARGTSALSLKALYDLWRKPPYGMRRGVLPVLGLAFCLAHPESIAVLLSGNFLPSWDDFAIDRLLDAPAEISLRWVESGDVGAKTLLEVARFAETLGVAQGGKTALAVTKPLVQFALRLPGWLRRTRRLKAETQRIRDVLIEANDPYLLLFNRLPEAMGLLTEMQEEAVDPEIIQEFVRRLGDAVEELRGRQESLLAEFEELLATELHCNLRSLQELEALAGRALGVAKEPSDPRTKRFAQILAGAPRNGSWVEDVCGLAAGRLVREWSDPDADKCVLELRALAEQFGRTAARIDARGARGERLRNTAADLLNKLKASDLDPTEQRAALLLALDGLGAKVTVPSVPEQAA